MNVPFVDTGGSPVSTSQSAPPLKSAATSTTKPVILFIGSFAPAVKDGGVGGQLYACRTLIESGLSSHVQWRLIDGTQRSVPPPNILVRAWHAAARVLQLMRHLARGDIDVVLIFTGFEPASLLEKGLMCVLARAPGRRTVVSLRSEIRRLSWPAMWAARAMIRACDAIICQSQPAADGLARLFPLSAQKTTVISNWIDARPFQDDEKRERANDGESPVLLFMGQLEPYKGPDTLLAAAALLQQRGIRFRLVLCGNGSLREELVSKSHELEIADAIAWRGWVHGQAKQAVFREADLFVLPSRDREGVPNVLLEAMAAGLPLVTTSISGIPSIVADGVNAVVVPPDDPPALASAIEQALADPHQRRAMARINRQAALAHDVERVWPRLAEAILGHAIEREGT